MRHLTLLSLALLMALPTTLLGCTADPGGELDGELVFTRRDGDVLVLYMSEADGSGERRLFRGQDPTNANVLSPRWDSSSLSGPRVVFTAMKEGSWKSFSLDPASGKVEMRPDLPPALTSRASHAEDLIVDKGSVWRVLPGGERKQLYWHKNHDSKFNPGASELRWGPGGKHVIFQACRLGKCRVMVAPADGSSKAFTVTSGRSPDWRSLMPPARPDKDKAGVDPRPSGGS